MESYEVELDGKTYQGMIPSCIQKYVCLLLLLFYLSVWQLEALFRTNWFSTPMWTRFGFSPWFLTSYSSTFQRGILSRQTLELPYPLNPRQFKFWEKIAAVVNLQKLSTLKPKQESTSVQKNLYIRCLNLSLFLSSRSRILWFRNQIMIVWST